MIPESIPLLPLAFLHVLLCRRVVRKRPLAHGAQAAAAGVANAWSHAWRGGGCASSCARGDGGRRVVGCWKGCRVLLSTFELRHAHTSTTTHTHTRAHKHMQKLTHTHTHRQAHAHTHTYIYADTNTYAYRCTFAHSHTHTCTQTQIHTVAQYTQTHTHTHLKVQKA